jgi:hypothetical protein
VKLVISEVRRIVRDALLESSGQLQRGARVRVPKRPGLVWEVDAIIPDPSGQGEKWYKLKPVDPVTNKIAPTVLTKSGNPVDYTAWLKSYNNRDWTRGGKGHSAFIDAIDAYVEENGGPADFNFNRPISLSKDYLEPIVQELT